MKKILLAVLAIVMMIGCSGKKEENVIKIACNLPLTGNFSVYGTDVKNGIEMARIHYKDSCLKYGLNIRVDYQDNSGDSKKAVSVYKSHELEGYDIYVSGITPQTAAILNFQKQSKLPHFIWSFAPLMLDDYPNLYRMWVDYPKEAEYFLNYIVSKNYKNIACIYPNAESAHTIFNELFIPKAEELGLKVVCNEEFDVSMSDFKNSMAKIKSSNPDVILVNGWDSHLLPIIKEVHNNNLLKDGNVVFTFDFMDVVGKLSDEYLNGMIANIPDYEISDNEEKKIWQKNYEQLYNCKPTYTAAYAYDFFTLLYDVYKRAKLTDDKIDFNIDEYIMSSNFNGITGVVKFSSSGEQIGKYQTCRYDDGCYVVINK